MNSTFLRNFSISFCVYCDQDRYEPVYGVRAETRATVLQAVVGLERGGCGVRTEGGEDTGGTAIETDD